MYDKVEGDSLSTEVFNRTYPHIESVQTRGCLSSNRYVKNCNQRRTNPTKMWARRQRKQTGYLLHRKYSQGGSPRTENRLTFWQKPFRYGWPSQIDKCLQRRNEKLPEKVSWLPSTQLSSEPGPLDNLEIGDRRIENYSTRESMDIGTVPTPALVVHLFSNRVRTMYLPPIGLTLVQLSGTVLHSTLSLFQP